MRRSIYFMALVFGFSAALVRAGNGPANNLIIYNPADANAVAVASYYQQLRDIPDINMMPYYFPTTTTSTYTNLSYVGMNLNTNQAFQLISAIRDTLSSRNISNQIDVITLVGTAPNTVETSGGKISITTTLAGLGSIQSVEDFAGTGSLAVNALYRGDSDMSGSYGPYPNLDATEIRHDKKFVSAISGQTNSSYIAFSLGFSGWRGNTAVESFNVLERAAYSDGTLTDPNLRGTIYWPTNAGVRFAARSDERPVTNEWAALGLPYSFTDYRLENRDGVGPGVPVNQRSVMGIFGSYSAYNFSSIPGTTFVPGAFGDTLTSFAGAYQNGQQGKLTEYFRAGLAGSAGTVVEPAAFKEKFLHARAQSFYGSGASLGESFYQSVVWLQELLMGGDPLTQPFADIPAVTISAPANGATVSGSISVAATATAVAGVETNLDLAVDGRIVRPGLPAGETISATRVAGGFTLDTTTLSDGYHEFRLIAYNTTPVRSQGYALRPVTVNNAGMGVALSAPATLDRRASGSFTVTPTGLSGVTNISIRFLGQKLANLGAGGGTVSIPGSRFGFHGTNSVYAVAERNDGSQISSAPQQVVMTWSALPAVPQAVNSNAVAYVRYFSDVTQPGFSWDASSPDATFFYTDPNMYGLTFSPNIGSYFPYSTVGNTKVGHEFTTYFNAPQDDIYDFVVSGKLDQKALFIDGAPMYTNVAAIGNDLYPVIASEKLAAGQHQIIFRGVGSSFLKIGVRGADIIATNYFQPSDEVPLTSFRTDFDPPSDILMGSGASPAPNSYAPNWAVNPPPAPPTSVTITAPVDGTIITATNVVTLSSSATYPSGANLPITVRYYSGSTLLGSSTNAPNYTLTTGALASGSYSVHAEATDRFYQTVTSAVPVAVTIGALSAPTANPPGGIFASNVTVQLNHPDPATTIYYTTNSYYATSGLTLTTASATVSPGASILLTPPNAPVSIIRMMADKPGANLSAINNYAFRQGWGMLSAGGTHALALKADGSLAAWGDNSRGQLGQGDLVTPELNATTVPGLGNMVSVAGGGLHTLAIDQHARVWAWGQNTDGQLGVGDQVDASSPVLITDANFDLGVRAVAAGINFSLALRQDGKIFGWGDNHYGQADTGKANVYGYTAPALGSTGNYTALAAGGYHGLAITRNPGTVYVWGRNDDGQLGLGHYNNVTRNAQVMALPTSSFTAVAGGLGHSLVLKMDGTVWAWGRNDFGQLGTGNTVSTNLPVQVGGLNNIVAIAAGKLHSMALDSNGRVWTWGYNNAGQLGQGTQDTSAHPTPTMVGGLTSVVSISAHANSDSSYVIRSNGAVQCWGEGGNGQLGNGSTADFASPVSVLNLQITPPSGIGDPTNQPTVAITSPADGALISGENQLQITAVPQGGTVPYSVLFTVNGTMLGTVTNSPYSILWSGMTNGVYTLGATVVDSEGLSATSSPVQVTFDAVPVISQTPTFNPPAGIYSDIQGILIQGADTNSVVRYTINGADPTASDPVLAAGEKLVVNQDTLLKARLFIGTQNPGPVAAALYRIGSFRRSIDGGATFALMCGGDGVVRSWGSNLFGELGLGNEDVYSTPSMIAAVSNFVSVSAGENSSLAMNRSGTLYAWGANWGGQLGNGTANDTNVPVAVNGMLNNVRIARMGGGHALAVKTDGTVWTWGFNDSGQLGNGSYDYNEHFTPTVVSNLSSIVDAVAGSAHNLVLDTNGVVWGWGWNRSGQVGVPLDFDYEMVPVTVMTGVRAIACGQKHSFAIKTNGTVWAWGNDVRGTLGIGPTGTVNDTPTQVLNLPTNIVALAAGSFHSMALDSEGNVWTWGFNSGGQLGIGVADGDSHPYPAVLTSLSGVVEIGCANKSCYAIKADGSVWVWGDNTDGALGYITALSYDPTPTKLVGWTLPAGFATGVLEPANLASTASSSINVDGAAFSPAGIQAVTVNGMPVTTSNGWTNWTVNVGGLVDGTNLITVVTTDSSTPAQVITNYLQVVYAAGGGLADSDSDGIPDSWEEQYFGGATNANPAAIAANGVNTVYETYIAGLDPTNTQSFFTVSDQIAAAQMVLQWSATSGRVYSVYWTTNLLDGFQPLETNLPYPQNSWTDQVHGAENDGFYQLKVQLGQ